MSQNLYSEMFEITNYDFYVKTEKSNEGFNMTDHKNVISNSEILSLNVKD